MEPLSLQELCWGNLEADAPLQETLNGYVKEGSGRGHFS